jgi:DNA-directed RNA polymerase subunit RPC12/RpoP
MTDIGTGEHMWVDGNSLGGVLREIFAFDVTGATGRCANCGNTGPVGETHVYSHSAGMVARCPTCDSVLMRVVSAPDRMYLDMHGMSFLELRPPGMEMRTPGM